MNCHNFSSVQLEQNNLPILLRFPVCALDSFEFSDKPLKIMTLKLIMVCIASLFKNLVSSSNLYNVINLVKQNPHILVT